MHAVRMEEMRNVCAKCWWENLKNRVQLKDPENKLRVVSHASPLQTSPF
jgi:hypothetical protein